MAPQRNSFDLFPAFHIISSAHLCSVAFSFPSPRDNGCSPTASSAAVRSREQVGTATGSGEKKASGDARQSRRWQGVVCVTWFTGVSARNQRLQADLFSEGKQAPTFRKQSHSSSFSGALSSPGCSAPAACSADRGCRDTQPFGTRPCPSQQESSA